MAERGWGNYMVNGSWNTPSIHDDGQVHEDSGGKYIWVKIGYADGAPSTEKFYPAASAVADATHSCAHSASDRDATSECSERVPVSRSDSNPRWDVLRGWWAERGVMLHLVAPRECEYNQVRVG
jgi:hypothetical protein